MTGLRVEIRRYVRADFPGWVECVLTDVHGQVWKFVEKVPVVTAEPLDATSTYPRPGVIGCEVVQSSEVVVIETVSPWGVEATTGETRFEVRLEQVVEFDFGPGGGETGD
jgi:hypothetical protein